MLTLPRCVKTSFFSSLSRECFCFVCLFLIFSCCLLSSSAFLYTQEIKHGTVAAFVEDPCILSWWPFLLLVLLIFCHLWILPLPLPVQVVWAGKPSWSQHDANEASSLCQKLYLWRHSMLCPIIRGEIISFWHAFFVNISQIHPVWRSTGYETQILR